MSLLRKFVIAFFTSIILAVVFLVVSPPRAWADGVCPPSRWGINSGNSSHPAGLVLKTVDESNNPINGITWRINADSASIVLSDASGTIHSNVSSQTFTTGETIWCGSPTDNYSGVTVLGFGSTNSYGNHWVLWCQKWGTSNIAGYSINNADVASPAGRVGTWSGGGNFNVTNGGTTTITLTWHDAPDTTLNVLAANSNGGVGISGSLSGTSGTTNYPIVKAGGFQTTLTAPPTANGQIFDHWEGCNAVGGTDCAVGVASGDTKNVVVYYRPPPPTTLNVQSVNSNGGVGISGSLSGTSGTTNYPIVMADAFSTTLTAPPDANGQSFDFWHGDCNTIDGRNCTVNVTRSETKNVIVYYRPPTTLNVQSVNSNGGIEISGSTQGTSGRTNYPIVMADAFQTTLTAPLGPSDANGQSFDFWHGDCNTIDGRNCTVSVARSQTKNVIVYYRPPTGKIIGRIWIDTNANGAHDAGEKFVRDPDSTAGGCTNYQNLNESGVRYSGNKQSGTVDLIYCDTDPYSDTGQILAEDDGNYSVYAIPPPGWIKTGISQPAGQSWTLNTNTFTASGKLFANETIRFSFGISPLPTCTITASPISIEARETTTLTWSAQNTTRAFLYTNLSETQINITPFLPSGSFTGSPSTTVDYIIEVHNLVTDNFNIDPPPSCRATVTVTSIPPPELLPPPLPEPEEGLQLPPPPPEIKTIQPNACQEAVETDKLTDNYITNDLGDAPISESVSAEGAENTQVTLSFQKEIDVDFSNLQALFGYQTADYLEGDFTGESHRSANLVDLKRADFNSYHGPLQKDTPKVIVDEQKVKYVQYVYNKPNLSEGTNTYTDIYGRNPKTIAAMIEQFGTPNPPKAGEDRTAWMAAWGLYWAKIPTAYNELYLGKLEFTVVPGEENYEKAKSGEICPIMSARTIEFVMPDFGRTTLVSDVINQVLVPNAAQSFREHRVPTQSVGQTQGENFLAKTFDFCKRILIGAPKEIINNFKKIIKITQNFVNPVKPAYAQTSGTDEDSCITPVPSGKEGIAPFCALPQTNSEGAPQLLAGDSCGPKETINQLNADNQNVICKFKITVNINASIGPGDPIWDSCTDLGGGNWRCYTKIRVFPNFRIPWSKEIWNNVLASEGASSGLGDTSSVLGETTDNKGSKPGIYSKFMPRGVFKEFMPTKEEITTKIVNDCYPNFPDMSVRGDDDACAELGGAIIGCLLSTGFAVLDPELFDKLAVCVHNRLDKSLSAEAYGSSYDSVKELYGGAVDCSKQFVRDLSKPKALQKYLGITNECALYAGVPEKEAPPPEPGGDTPPNAENCDGEYALDNPLGNFGDPNCDFSQNDLHILLKTLDPLYADYWFNTIIPCESNYNPNSYLTGDRDEPFHSPNLYGAWGLFQMGNRWQYNNEYDRGDVVWKRPEMPSLEGQVYNAVKYNGLINHNFAYWACSSANL
ncbi:MAG: hypothetical protein UT84_C0021G0004 [Candidatus Curtissbacteria bacterium GW2011_GWA1_40_16]|uniref:Uncharacterized protein n=1 Tax=Candidatus Curtissbacteria bacterium GW2011_GWA1_40_16 TaxID=1618405 RepID=A0A0G0RBF2_9BACT|nr:MAG: hypothetical protein UT84_C0021G0004 [Candidatus Curtissbacteria bacterium GW2011_GWA1_40_16]